jgi:hypothetical protein
LFPAQSFPGPAKHLRPAADRHLRVEVDTLLDTFVSVCLLRHPASSFLFVTSTSPK